MVIKDDSRNNKQYNDEYLEVRWNELTSYGYAFKRFKRMGALLEWVEKNPKKMVTLAIFVDKKKTG